ncbi:GFA family protein [Nioella aestuarii]|uniref:GFA family protein n=1 Tax=Nioella aestuarii TaxID=1662864 RepID=UPI003D7F7556
MRVDGGCLCGYIRYEAEIDADRVAICHCQDCQVNSGAAFGLVAGVVGGAFTLLCGELASYNKIAESGRIRKLSFCPTCGTRIHACTEDDPTAFFGLRVGTIRQRAVLTPKVQVWCKSALPWVPDMASIPIREAQ